MNKGDSLVRVAFKPEAKQSEIEKVLAQFTHEKLFKDDEILGEGRDVEILRRLYVFQVPYGKESECIASLESQYKTILEYAEPAAPRKLIRPKKWQ